MVDGYIRSVEPRPMLDRILIGSIWQDEYGNQVEVIGHEREYPDDWVVFRDPWGIIIKVSRGHFEERYARVA